MVFVRYARFAADNVLPRQALHFSQNLFKRHNNTFLSFSGSLEFAFFQISSNFSAVLCTVTLRSFSPSNSSFEKYLATSPYVGKSAVGRSAGLPPNMYCFFEESTHAFRFGTFHPRQCSTYYLPSRINDGNSRVVTKIFFRRNFCFVYIAQVPQVPWIRPSGTSVQYINSFGRC